VQNRVTMPYSQTTDVVAAATAPRVAVRSPALNERATGQDRPDWVGRQRDNFGRTVLEVFSEPALDQAVARAFSDGLSARGLLAADEAQAPYVLTITIHQFDASRYGRSEATADFSVALSERASGREIWRDRQRSHNVQGEVFNFDGAAAMTQQIRDTALLSMNQAVDALLDKDEFRAALRR
jgi:hypothetical protein